MPLAARRAGRHARARPVRRRGDRAGKRVASPREPRWRAGRGLARHSGRGQVAAGGKVLRRSAGRSCRATVTASVRTPATAGLARGGRSRRSAQQPGRAATWGTPPAPRPESPAARGALAEPDGRRGKQLGGRLPPGVGVRRGRGAAARGDGAGAGGGAGRETRRGRRATWRSPRGGVARGACSAVSPQRTSFCSVRRVP